MTTASLAWMAYALRLSGTRELPGAANSKIIAGWLKGLRAWWFDDATPWCGVFVAHVMQTCGHALPTHWYRARAWLDWGKPCQPAYGAICVLDRQGGGHVFFMTRVSRDHVWGIGGNQSDMVCEAKFDRARVLGFRWPSALASPVPAVAVVNGESALSRNEA